MCKNTAKKYRETLEKELEFAKTRPISLARALPILAASSEIGSAIKEMQLDIMKNIGIPEELMMPEKPSSGRAAEMMLNAYYTRLWKPKRLTPREKIEMEFKKIKQETKCSIVEKRLIPTLEKIIDKKSKKM